jgi:hypothetical protein
MRDGQIFDLNQRRAKNEALLYRQIGFLNTRMEAFEAVLSTRWAMIRAVLNPQWLKAAVNKKQLEIMKAHDDELKEAAKENAMKPKLTIVKAVAVILAFGLFSGCVSKTYHKRVVENAYTIGFTEADEECIELQRKIQSYVGPLQERLRRFNQLNDDGSLRGLPKQQEPPFATGEETWQK